MPLENRPPFDDEAPENLEARVHRASQNGRLVMAYHNVTWADCGHHDHLEEARTLLDQFWEDHRASPPPDEAPSRPPPVREGEPPMPMVQVAAPVRPADRAAEPRRKTAPGVLVGLLIVGSWLPIAFFLASLATSALVRIGLFALLAYATLALGVLVLRRLGVSGSKRHRTRLST